MEPYKNFRNNYIETKDILRKLEEEYFVFVYWTICPHCLALVSDINRYLSKERKVKLYLLDFTKEKDAILFKNTEQYKDEDKMTFIERYSKDSIGAKEVKDINYYYVPMLLHIKNGAVYNCIVLEDKISNYLKGYEE